MFLLDTNVLIWLTTHDNRLSLKVRKQLEQPGQRELGASVLCNYEFGIMAAEKRIGLKREFPAYRRDLRAAGLRELAVTPEIVMDALALDNLSRDPIDKVVVATARSLGATLVTSDRSILSWRGDLDRLDAL